MTVSSDRTLKVWDIHDNKPAFLWTKDLKLVRVCIFLWQVHPAMLLITAIQHCPLSTSPSLPPSLPIVQGAIFAARFCPDSPLLLAVGGEKDGLRVLSLDRVADSRCPDTHTADSRCPDTHTADSRCPDTHTADTMRPSVMPC